jgi:hypothetical protein
MTCCGTGSRKAPYLSPSRDRTSRHFELDWQFRHASHSRCGGFAALFDLTGVIPLFCGATPGNLVLPSYDQLTND